MLYTQAMKKALLILLAVSIAIIGVPLANFLAIFFPENTTDAWAWLILGTAAAILAHVIHGKPLGKYMRIPFRYVLHIYVFELMLDAIGLINDKSEYLFPELQLFGTIFLVWWLARVGMRKVTEALKEAEMQAAMRHPSL